MKEIRLGIFLAVVMFAVYYMGARTTQTQMERVCQQRERDGYTHGYAVGYEDAYFKLTNDESPLAKEGNYE